MENQEKFEIQVEIGKDGKKIWTSIRPSGSVIPYRFTTRQKAIEMAEICYGGNFTPYRIV